MERKLRGFALMLLSLILIIGFSSTGWYWVFDLSITWQMLWMLLGIVGFFMVWFDRKKQSKD